MIKFRIFTTILLLGFLTPAFCQLQKGDWMLDFPASLHTDNYKSFDQTLFYSSFAPSAGYMFTDRLMAGAGLGFYSGNGWSPGAFDYHIYRYECSPFARYYFLKKEKWMGFAFGEAYFQNRQNGIIQGDSVFSTWPDGWAYSLGTGIGANYFLAPNVAIEAKAGLRLAKDGDYDIFPFDRDKLFLSIGINTFLHQRQGEKFDLLDRYLRKGNHIVEGEAYFRNNNYQLIGSAIGAPPLDEWKGYSLYLGLGFQKFVTGRLAIGGGLGLSRATSDVNSNSYFRLNANAERYFPVAGRLFFVPFAELGWTHGVTKANQLDYQGIIQATIGEINGVPIIGPVPFYDTTFTTTRVNTLHSKANFQLKYFTQNSSIVSGGLGAEFSSGNTRVSEINTLAINAFTGYEHFFAENLGLSARLYFRLYDSGRIQLLDQGVRSAGISFSIKYFIFSDLNQN